VGLGGMTRPRMPSRTLTAGRCECTRDGAGDERECEMVPSSTETHGSSARPLSWGPARTALLRSCPAKGMALGESPAPPVETACFCGLKGRDAGAPCATLTIADGSLAGGVADGAPADRTARPSREMLAVGCEARTALAGLPCVAAVYCFSENELGTLTCEPPLLSWPTGGDCWCIRGTCESRTAPGTAPAGPCAGISCLLRAVSAHVYCARGPHGRV
jgi:hypothetical protein